MKKLSCIVVVAVGCIMVSCENSGSHYVDLNTGKEVELVKDEGTGVWVESDTKKPPTYIYVDTKKNDTIYGPTGEVINGKIKKTDAGVYTYSAYEYKSPDGDLKVEVEKDGDIKIKDGDNKIKIDGETGEKKVKKD